MIGNEANVELPDSSRFKKPIINITGIIRYNKRRMDHNINIPSIDHVILINSPVIDKIIIRG
jgi:hypothetical protein